MLHLRCDERDDARLILLMLLLSEVVEDLVTVLPSSEELLRLCYLSRISVFCLCCYRFFRYYIHRTWTSVLDGTAGGPRLQSPFTTHDPGRCRGHGLAPAPDLSEAGKTLGTVRARLLAGVVGERAS